MIPEGALVRVAGGEKEGRPGVVLRVLNRDGRTLLFVPWGTGTLRAEKPHVAVQPESSAGRALGIFKPTFFYSNNVTMCPPADVELVNPLCPPWLFVAIQKLYGA